MAPVKVTLSPGFRTLLLATLTEFTENTLKVIFVSKLFFTITVSVPDKLLEEFKKQFPEVNVAELARRAVKRKVEELEKLYLKNGRPTKETIERGENQRKHH